VDESTTPNLSRPEPPALEVGSPAAAALHRIWSGCRTAEVLERCRSGRIEAVVAIASQLAARTDLSVNVDATWHDDRVELAWAFAHHLPRNSIGCPKATHPRQPPEGVGPFPDGPASVRLGSMGTHRPFLAGGLMPLETTTTRAVTVVFADHEDDRLQGAAWASDARIIVVAPCSVVPASWPVDEFRLGDVPLDIVVAGAPVSAQ
jgi:hypothetical protein